MKARFLSFACGRGQSYQLIVVTLLLLLIWGAAGKNVTLTLLVPGNRYRCFLETVPQGFTYKVEYEVIDPILPDNVQELPHEEQKFRFLVKHTKISSLVLFNGPTQTGKFLFTNTNSWSRDIEHCIFNDYPTTLKIRITILTAYELGDASALAFNTTNKKLVPHLMNLEQLVHTITPAEEYLSIESQILASSESYISWISNYGLICVILVVFGLFAQTFVLRNLLIDRKTK